MNDVKYVCVVIDDFTSRSLNYDNVTVYDFGIESSVTRNDAYYYDYRYSFDAFDFGDIDSMVTNWEVLDYYNLNQFYAPVVTDSGTIGPDLRDYNYFNNLYMYEGYVNYATTQALEHFQPNPTALTTPGHGDWVLETFFQQLDDPDSVEIIAIDADFTSQMDMSFLFETKQGHSNLSWIVNNAINDFYEAGTEYVITGLNASWGGPLDNGQISAVETLLNEWGAVVVQAVANTNQWSIPWGLAESNVINVGAYNTDQNGNILFSDDSGISSVDVLADGYVLSDDGWGWNFGTSFATPRVLAEIVNTYDSVLTDDVISGAVELQRISDMDRLSDGEVRAFTDSLLDDISTPIDINTTATASTWKVLSDDVATSPSLTVVPHTFSSSNQTLLTANYITESPIEPVNEKLANEPVLATQTHALTVIANVFDAPMFLDGLTETVTSTSHTIEYNGTTFDYAEVDGMITTVVRDGQFTSEFAAEIAESFPDNAGISYSTAVALIGQANMESTLLAVAVADGNYVG